MIYTHDHRTRHNLDIPRHCEGFTVDDYVQYFKDNKMKRGYIYCFRQFGYNWFAWIYFDKNKIKPVENVFVGDLCKVEEK